MVAVFVFAVRSRRMPLLETTLVVLFFLGALHSARISIYLYVAVAGLAASLPVRRIWGPRARRIAGALGIGLFLALTAYPSVPAGTGAGGVGDATGDRRERRGRRRLLRGA